MAQEIQAAPERHPRGLYTLFLTEMWERCSYYGNRGLLILFMTAAMAKGGLGMTDKEAAAIYGLYTAGVYLAALPGGWVADRLLGAQRSVWLGGLLIIAGQFTLAWPSLPTFYLGLGLLVMGTGLLKPNISTMVGQLYPEGGARRDAGFTLFYMGINLGAAIGPLVCSTLGEKFSWRYGFLGAGAGMILGLIQFGLTSHHLGLAGKKPGHGGQVSPRDVRLLLGALVVVAAVVGLALAGVLKINPLRLAEGATKVIVAIAVAYFTGLFLFLKLDRTEKMRLGVVVILFASSAMFWSGFEQAGSSLNLFADRYTNRVLGFLKYEIPAGWFQSVNPSFIILLAPVVAAVWIRLERRGLNPSLPVKFALGLFLLAGGFLVMAVAATSVAAGVKVLPPWLIVTYLLHSLGELCLSPVGLSSITKLAPQRLVGQMMGLWFLATSFGNLIAGLMAGNFSADAVDQMPALFRQIVMTAVITGTVMLILARPIKRMLTGVK